MWRILGRRKSFPTNAPEASQAASVDDDGEAPATPVGAGTRSLSLSIDSPNSAAGSFDALQSTPGASGAWLPVSPPARGETSSRSSAAYEASALEDEARVAFEASPDECAETSELLFELLPFCSASDQSASTVSAVLSTPPLEFEPDDHRDAQGNTLLIVCAQYSLYDAGRSLLSLGANACAANHGGATALHFACCAESLNEPLAVALLECVRDRGGGAQGSIRQPHE